MPSMDTAFYAKKYMIMHQLNAMVMVALKFKANFRTARL
jgi:hypothetical protein